MPRLDPTSAQFYSNLATELKTKDVSPEQIQQLSRAIRTLPNNVRLTDKELEPLSKSLGLTPEHKATLIVALLMHRYAELFKNEIKDANAWSNGLSGMLEALVNKANTDQGSAAVHAALESFYAGYAGSRASVAESGQELFRGAAPLITVPDPKVDHVRVAAQNGSFVEDPQTGWAFRADKQGEQQPADVPLASLGVQALEFLAQGLATFIGSRTQGQQNPKPDEALKMARDISLAADLLAEVERQRVSKNESLAGERTQRASELGRALGNFRVSRMGAETVNALVDTFFPHGKVTVSSK